MAPVHTPEAGPPGGERTEQRNRVRGESPRCAGRSAHSRSNIGWRGSPRWNAKEVGIGEAGVRGREARRRIAAGWVSLGGILILILEFDSSVNEEKTED